MSRSTNNNGAIPWRISTSEKVKLKIFFASSHRCRNIHISKLGDLGNVGQVMMYDNRSDVLRWQLPDYDGNSSGAIVCNFPTLSK